MKTITFSSRQANGVNSVPELPEVETVRAGLEQAWVGRTIEQVILRRTDLRFPFPERMAETLTGQTVLAVRRRAKYLLVDLSEGQVFLSHLGMSGRYTLVTPTEVTRLNPSGDGVERSAFGELTGFDGRHDHMEFRFDDGSTSVYTDPRRFGIADLFERAEEPVQSLLEHLGPEPFADWNSTIAAERIGAKRSAIKITLLDQRFVVGVGNIYACELFTGLAFPQPRLQTHLFERTASRQKSSSDWSRKSRLSLRLRLLLAAQR